jgi:hypothetical protein
MKYSFTSAANDPLIAAVSSVLNPITEGAATEELKEGKIDTTPQWKTIEDSFARLNNTLQPNALVPRTVAKEFGAGYAADFAKILDLIEKANDLWDEIRKDVDMPTD